MSLVGTVMVPGRVCSGQAPRLWSAQPDEGHVHGLGSELARDGFSDE